MRLANACRNCRDFRHFFRQLSSAHDTSPPPPPLMTILPSSAPFAKTDCLIQ